MARENTILRNRHFKKILISFLISFLIISAIGAGVIFGIIQLTSISSVNFNDGIQGNEEIIWVILGLLVFPLIGGIIISLSSLFLFSGQYKVIKVTKQSSSKWSLNIVNRFGKQWKWVLSSNSKYGKRLKNKTFKKGSIFNKYKLHKGYKNFSPLERNIELWYSC